MKITKQLRNLKSGTTIYRWTGAIVLTSDYDETHGWYSYAVGHVYPSDLIGGEIF